MNRSTFLILLILVISTFSQSAIFYQGSNSNNYELDIKDITATELHIQDNTTWINQVIMVDYIYIEGGNLTVINSTIIGQEIELSQNATFIAIDSKIFSNITNWSLDNEIQNLKLINSIVKSNSFDSYRFEVEIKNSKIEVNSFYSNSDYKMNVTIINTTISTKNELLFYYPKNLSIMNLKY